MSKKIIFQKCNFNYIYFLFNIITTFLNFFVEYKLYPDESEIKEPEHHYYLPMQMINYLYTYNLSDFLAVIPYLIRNRILKEKGNNIINDRTSNIHPGCDSISLIYINSEESESKKKKKEIILYLAIIAVLDFLQKFTNVLYNIIFYENDFSINAFSCVVPFEIIMQFICSYFILKVHFYKLQYFSLFLNLGIFIIILILDLVNIKSNSINGINAHIYYFFGFSIIFYCIEYSYVKKILLYGYISIYFLMIIKGMFVFFLVLIFSLIMLLAKKDVFRRIGFFLTPRKYLWLVIARIFSNFFVSITLWLIIDRFSANYLPFSLLFNEVIYFVVDIICCPENYEKIRWDFYFRIFLYVISFIGVTIHNEIIVINVCNLGSDTKYFLDLEVKNEELFANTDNPEIIKRYESFTEMSPIDEEDEDKIINEQEKTLDDKTPDNKI